jgi:hypothetical protein
MVGAVKIVVQVKLLPDAGQAPALEATLRAVNDAANLVSAVAFGRRVFREYDLRKHVTCRGCGVVAHADRNASRNIAARGQVAWNAGRQSRAPAPARHGQGLDAAASITASDALAASSVLQGRVS